MPGQGRSHRLIVYVSTASSKALLAKLLVDSPPVHPNIRNFNTCSYPLPSSLSGCSQQSYNKSHYSTVQLDPPWQVQAGHIGWSCINISWAGTHLNPAHSSLSRTLLAYPGHSSRHQLYVNPVQPEHHLIGPPFSRQAGSGLSLFRTIFGVRILMQAFQFGSFDFLSELFLGDNSEPKSSIWLAPVQYMNLSIGGSLSGNIVVLIDIANKSNISSVSNSSLSFFFPHIFHRHSVSKRSRSSKERSYPGLLATKARKALFGTAPVPPPFIASQQKQ